MLPRTTLDLTNQALNDIARLLSELIETLGGLGSSWVENSIGHNASGATGTAFTATGDQTVIMILASSTSGADAVTINWTDSGAATTHNIITDGVIGAAYPLVLPVSIALHEGDTITYAGADSDIDFTITWREEQP